MTAKLTTLFLSVLLFAPFAKPQPGPQSFLGFDRNEYPGDESLPALRSTFAYSSYWLNPPPGSRTNSWLGKRELLQKAGFGFLVLYNGKLYKQLKSLPDAAAAGKKDGTTASQTAQAEGFPKGTVIFLDQEEGGRLFDIQKAYIYAFADAVTKQGFRAGVYCSGTPLTEPDGTVITTAGDLQSHAGGRQLAYWISNDACPPSPGCSLSPLPPPAGGGIRFAEVWQYAQSPRRPQYTAACARTYGADKNCYAPATHIHVDLNTSTSRDPSHGRR